MRANAERPLGLTEEEQIKNALEDKTVLVTGGLGSIGGEIVRRLVDEYSTKKIIIFDNRETELFYAKQAFSDKVHVIYGDVRDARAVERAFKGVNIVFHAAAMKHVIMCEMNPFEAVKTNVIGTENVINAAVNNRVEKVVVISTDKAVNPTNVMGATKLLAERLVSAFCSSYNKDNAPRFSVVRFGNVLASRGSVLEIWDKQLRAGEKITVTDPDMTRFFMDVSQSVYLIFSAMVMGKRGETFIFKMPSIKIGDLARAFLEVRGYPADHVKITGKRPGEKTHEELLNNDEKEFLLENEKMFVRLPLFYDQTVIENLKRYDFREATNYSFSSADENNLLDFKDIIAILEKNLKNELTMNK